MKDVQDIYQSTALNLDKNYDDEGDEFELASAGKRISAYILNNLIGAIAYIPIVWGTMELAGGFAGMDPENMDAAMPEPSGFALGLIGLGAIMLLAYLIFQAVLMSKTGQSLGKRLMNIKVVDEEGENPGFKGVVLMREVVPNLILAVVAMIPVLGSFVQLGFWIACLVMLFLVDRNRQTLQDLIAKTYVVDAN